jgi:hypothetical protein
MCSYSVGGDRSLATTITFQTDSKSDFVRGEAFAKKLSGASGQIVAVHGLGRAAWRDGAGVHVFDGREDIHVSAPWLAVWAPATVIPRTEALARALL